MSKASKAFVESLVQVVGETHRASLEAVVADSRRDQLRAVQIEHELDLRRAGGLAKLRRVHAARFGSGLPKRLEEMVAALDERSLELAAVLVEDSKSADDLTSRFDVLERACIEERRRGAGTVLSRMLERRFGLKMEYDLRDVCRVANAYDLDGCFARLESATSLDDVIGPLLRRLDDRIADLGVTADAIADD